MSLSAFLAQNAVRAAPVSYIASPRFLSGESDADGNPVPQHWKIRCMTGAETELLQQECVRSVPIPGRPGRYQREMDPAAFTAKMAARCTVYPDLNNKELQDSYGVMGAEALLKAMLTSGEYLEYLRVVQKVNGFHQSDEDLEEQAKN